MKSASIRWRMAFLAVGFLLMVWGFQSLLFHHAPDAFSEPREDMTYAWYVPLFSLYVVWTERGKILASLGRPSWIGLLLTLPCLFLGFLGVRGIQIRFEIVAFAGLLVTVPWALFGRETAKRLLFPAGFLLFCIPLATFLDVITVHLRLFATGLAAAILHGVGAGIVRTGTMLAASNGSFAIDVAEPCSGLRSIFALMALTAGYAYFNQPTWLRRALLFACSVPLAVFGNVMRILTICLVGRFASPDFATGFYHDYSGYVVFIAAIALMVVCGEGITRVAEALAKGRGDAGRKAEDAVSAPVPGTARGGWFVPCLTLAALAAVMCALARTPEAFVCEPPAAALGELDGFVSEKTEVSEAELTVLPADTRFDKRLYRAEDGHWYAVSVVIGGTSKSSIHRPELCLPSQGFLMTEPHTVRLPDGSSWRIIRLDGGADRPSCGFAYTFFNQAGYRTSSHVDRIFRDVWDRSFHNRIDRWVMVTVHSSQSDDRGLADFLMRLKGLSK